MQFSELWWREAKLLENASLIPGEGGDFSLCHCIQTSSVTHEASCAMGTKE